LLAALPALLTVLAPGCATTAPARLPAADAARLRALEDREAIRQLLVDYGAALDRRDFAAFGALFTEDAEYVSGGTPLTGRAAIRAQLERTLSSNPMNLPAPNFHLSFNPSITLDGDRATAVSLGAYTAPDPAGGGTRLVFFVWYQDELVREADGWKFRRRVVGSGPLPGGPPGR
jgi:uncharacterized protein (TIGR02246 family)